MRSRVITPSATMVPGGRLERAISTPSSGCSRMTAGGGMRSLPCSSQERLAAAAWFRRRSRLSRSCLAVGILAGLRHLHPGVSRHQAAFVRQRHELETHIDRFRRTCRAAAVNARINAALAALLHELLIDLQDFRLFTIELRHQTIREAEIGGTDIDRGNALDVENGFHVVDRCLG